MNFTEYPRVLTPANKSQQLRVGLPTGGVNSGRAARADDPNFRSQGKKLRTSQALGWIASDISWHRPSALAERHRELTSADSARLAARICSIAECAVPLGLARPRASSCRRSYW